MNSAKEQVEEIVEEKGLAHFVSRLRGRNQPLRPSKPDAQGDTGLTQYVWRMGRFHSGSDTSMPVTCHWGLQTWLDDQGIEASVSGITDDAGQEVTGYLDAVVSRVLHELGLSDMKAARAWKGAGVFG